MKYDAAVIGGGPVGSQVASRLAEMGYGVAVLERRETFGKPCCTGIVGRECVDTFAIEKNAILREANGARLFSPSGKCLRLHREEPQAYVLARATFDQTMVRRAHDKGAEYYLNTTAENIEVGGDKVVIRTSQGDFEARAIVIAPGFGSALTDRLGKFPDFVAGAQAEVEASVGEVEVYFGREVAPGFFAWLVPTSTGKARVGLLSRQNPTRYLRKLLASLAEQGKIKSPEAEISHGAIPLKPLPHTCADRLLVVGDAAGHVKPTTGGGIYYGLLGADFAATTLHQALQGNDLSAESLAQYEREWKGRLGQELRTGYWARKFFEKLSDHQIDKIFDLVKQNSIDEDLLKAKDLSFDWHSRAIMRLLGHQVIATALNVFRLPGN